MVVQEWPRGIRVKQSQGKQIGGGKRGRVVDLSTGSRANMAWVYIQGPWRSMLTLTYHETFPDGRTSKAQLNTWLQHLRQRGIKYLWVLEWQGRGFPHYHVWMDAEFRDCPLWEDESDGKSWRPLMMHWLNITKQNVNQKTIDFALHQKTYCPWEVRAGNNYASKYASKQDQKGLPMGVESYGRWWGASVGINKPIRQIEIPEFSDIPEERDNLTKTVKFKRDAKRALEHWSTHPPKKRRTLSGFSAVLRENRKNDICRILSNHFPNPFDKKCQNQYARRAASLRANDDKIYNYLINEKKTTKTKKYIQNYPKKITLQNDENKSEEQKDKECNAKQLTKEQKNQIADLKKYRQKDESIYYYEDFDFQAAQTYTKEYIERMQAERQRHDDMLAEFVKLYYQNSCRIRPNGQNAKNPTIIARITKIHFWMRTIKSDESAKFALNALHNMQSVDYITTTDELANLLVRWKQNAYHGV